MSNNSVTDVTGTLYDSGGPNGDYGNNQDLVFTICPTVTCECLVLEFDYIDLEFDNGGFFGGGPNFYDLLYVHNGNSTSAPLLATLQGTSGPVNIYADSGCVTLHFDSDGSINWDGWEASWSCSSECPSILSTSTSEYSVTELVEDLFVSGSCVDVSNITFTGTSGAVGSFSSGGAIGIGEGIVLSTGYINSIPGINNSSGITDDLLASGDSDLNTIVSSSGQATEDASVLEFDFVPTTNEISFNYVFASDEYPEYVCSEYNDVFAFFISGPGFTGSQNIALVPGTSIPVAINSVNNGSVGAEADFPDCTSLDNSAYYVNNIGGASLEFDGFTTVLTATANVTPCQTYHIKLAVADVGDSFFDSAVFLEANSFAAGEGALVSATINSSPTASNEMYEGCQDGFFLFERGNTEDLSQPFTIDFVVTGTATAGVDYTPLPSSVIIPVGQTSVQIDITAFLDGIFEGPETIIVTVLNNFCICDDAGSLPAEIIILDNSLLEAELTEQSYCFNDPATLDPNPSGGIEPYTYQWSNGASTPSLNFNVVAGTSGTYTVTVSDICGNSATSAVNVTFELPPPPIDIIAPSILCGDSEPITLQASEPGGEWSGAGITDANAGTFDLAVAQATVLPPFSVTYTLTNNCGSSTETISFNFEDQPTANISGTGLLCPGETADMNLTVSFTGEAPWSFTYAIDGIVQAPITNITNNPYALIVNSVGDYTLIELNDSNCNGIIDGLASIEEFTPPNIILSGGGTLCNDNDVVNIEFTISGGQAPFDLVYTDGTNNFTYSSASGSFILDATVSGTYEIISITDSNGCEGTFSGTPEVAVSNLNINSAIPSPASCGNNDGGIDNVLVSGGTEPYTFFWYDQTDTQIGNTPSLTSIAAGNYTLIVSDGLFCTDTLVVVIDENTPPILSAGIATNALCGADNGSITGASVSGGTEPYFYFWKDELGNIISNNIDLENAFAGNYTLIVGDINGCQDSLQMSIADIPPPTLIGGNPNNASCGNSNGSITSIGIQSSAPPFNYVWTDENGNEVGENAIDLMDVPAGNYSLLVTDGNGCTQTLDFNIEDTSPPQINSAAIHPSTCSEANGAITDIFINGGTAPFFYEWQDENGNVIEDDLFLYGVLAGNYTLIVTDINGCADTLSYTIMDEPSPTLEGGETTPTICGADNGSITNISAEGESPPFEYQWTNSNGEVVGNELELQDVGLGDYTLQVTDANGCTDVISFAVLEVPVPILTAGIATPSTCGDSNGKIEGTQLSGGIEPFTLEWRNEADSLIATSLNLENTLAGIYTLTAMDGNGCTTNISIEIMDIPPPQLSGGEILPSSCSNNDGAINGIEVSGGTGELVYEWQNQAGEILGNELQLSNIPQGNYTLLVSDENGCETEINFNIIDLEAPQLIGGELQNTTCSEANGSITNVALESGVAPFTYEWQDGTGEVLETDNITSSLLQLRDVVAGTYTLIVTDSKGCAVSLQFDLEDMPSPKLSLGTATETICGEANGTISGVSIEGGTEPFTLEWKNETGETLGNELDIESLPTGNYTLQITDFNGCFHNIEMFVPEALPPQLQGGEVTSTTCSEANGSIEGIEVLDGAEPFEYSWLNNLGEIVSNENFLTDAVAGSYTLEILDANGCLTSIQWTIEDQIAPQLLGGNVLPSSCGKADGAIQNIEVNDGTGELVYEWQNTSGQIVGNELNLTDIAAGEYTLIVTDENGCSVEASFTTFDEAAPQLSGGVINYSNCGQADGGITDISIEGGTEPYTYAWVNENGETFGNDISLSAIPEGVYTLTATDVSGCITTLSFYIVDNPPPGLLGGLVTPTTCSEANGSIQGIEVENGEGLLTFSWRDGNNNEISTELQLTDVSAGIYTIYITDEKGCQDEMQYEIPDQVAPQIIEGLVDNARCSEANGGISNVVIEGGVPPYSFNWRDTESNAYENTGTGTDANLLNVAAGDYILEVTDGNGCRANLDFEVLDEASPTASGGLVNASTCSDANGSIEGIDIEGGTAPFNFEWWDVNGNVVGTEEVLSEVVAGNYTVIITDDNGCETDLAFVIADIHAPTLSEGTVDLSSCGNSDGGVLGVKIEGGEEPYTYRWENAEGEVFGNEIDLTNVAAGEYTLTAIDANGCEVSLGFNVSDVGAPAISGGVANQTICGSTDGRITGVEVSGGTGVLVITWADASGIVLGENVDIYGLTAGEYTLTAEDEGGCISSKNFVIEDIPPPSILGATVSPATCGASDGRITALVVQDGTEPFVYEWHSGETDEIIGNEAKISDLAAGTYLLLLTDANDCSDSREFLLENLDAPELSLENVTVSDCVEEGTGSATVKVLGGTAPFNFEWDTDPPQFTPTATNLRPGIYNVSVRDGNGCLASILVTVPGFIPPPIVGCSYQTTDSLEFVWTAVVGAIGYSIETDLGITDTVSADELSYLLAGIDDDLTVVISVTALGPDNCSNSEVAIQSCATLADCPDLELAIEVSNDVFCINEAAVSLKATPEGGVFEGTGWNGSAFDPTLAGIGEHTITYTYIDEMGCVFSANQTITIVDEPIAAMAMPEVICLGETATLSFVGNLPDGSTLQWDFGNGSTSNEVGPHTIDWTSTGIYAIALSVDNGVCVDEIVLDLVVSDISVEVSDIQMIKSGTVIDLGATVNSDLGEVISLEWLPSLDNLTGCNDCLNTTAQPFDPTNYTIIATNEYGCSATNEVFVDILPVPILTVPNAFSPNGDGINDVFQVQGKNIESVEFKVFSRWGEELFVGYSLDDFWDGTYKDENAELGVYVFYVRAFSFDGEEVFVKGNISLIR
ncbi:MAG: choice-of-anchor L domain-containing protein [Chitinophagales bacterium]